MFVSVAISVYLFPSLQALQNNCCNFLSEEVENKELVSNVGRSIFTDPIAW